MAKSRTAIAVPSLRAPHDVVPVAGKIHRGPIRYPTLDLQQPVLGIDAAEIDGLLEIEAEVDDVGEDMSVPQRLIAAADDPEGKGRPAILARHAGYDRVHGALARPDDIGMPRL